MGGEIWISAPLAALRFVQYGFAMICGSRCAGGSKHRASRSAKRHGDDTLDSRTAQTAAASHIVDVYLIDSVTLQGKINGKTPVWCCAIFQKN